MRMQTGDPAHSVAGQTLLHMFEKGQNSGWHGFIGGSASRWLRSQELMGFQSYLNLGAPYRPIEGVSVPRLARECFAISQQEGVKYDTGEDMREKSFAVVQVDDSGSRYRILWENTDKNHPPMELHIHLAVHSVRSNGPGGVVYHCQPLNIQALAVLSRQRHTDLEEELVHGFAAIRNVLPDGIVEIPWGMPAPIRRGDPMNAQMILDMGKFIQNIGAHSRDHEVVVLAGEGIICASHSEQTVFGIVSTVEHAAEIRLKVLSAGGV